MATEARAATMNSATKSVGGIGGKYVRRKVAELASDPANVRKHGEKNLDAIKASLTRFGQQKPIVVDRAGVVRAGNGTLVAAKALGWLEIDCVESELEGAEATAYAIADNRTAELAEWDDAALSAVLQSLEHEDAGLLDAAGFDQRELDKLMAQNAGEVIEDEAPEPPAVPITQAGDLWLLGEHRLLCGDSTKVEDVARVMDGQKGVLMNTDPPYGVALNLRANHEASNAAKGIEKTYREFGDIENDELTGAELQEFLEAAIRVAVPHLVDSAAFYLWHPMLTQGTFFAAAAAADILIHRQIVWVKPHFIFGRGDYHWRHELCFYGWRRGHRPLFNGERNQDTIWALKEGGGAIRKDQGHPTQKPVELFARPMLNHTREGEICYEPFSGSGSQIIAAEQLKRRCFAIEIEPKYCDVAVQRWEKLTGKKAQRVPA